MFFLIFSFNESSFVATIYGAGNGATIVIKSKFSFLFLSISFLFVGCRTCTVFLMYVHLVLSFCKNMKFTFFVTCILYFCDGRLMRLNVMMMKFVI